MYNYGCLHTVFMAHRAIFLRGLNHNYACVSIRTFHDPRCALGQLIGVACNRMCAPAEIHESCKNTLNMCKSRAQYMT